VPIDPTLVGASTDPYTVTWTSRDSIIYALGVGAGVNDLAYTTENTAGLTQRTLPTMPVTLTRDARALRLLGDIDWTRLVHAAQQLHVHRLLPADGTIRAVSRVTAIYDRERAAVIVIASDATDPDGTPMFQTTSWLHLSGEGGWGGDRGPSLTVQMPQRPADAEVRHLTSPDQALIYRLCGDRNRLHSDPALAGRAGFDRPILHGLCTYGFAARALLEAACDGKPHRIQTIGGRFAAPVRPGQALTTRIWRHETGAWFTTYLDDGTVVLADGSLTARPTRESA
jgi:acyl dehydratase